MELDFPKLSLFGHKKISRIQRKTAIIAFSAEEVLRHR
jgi:hypothetical protein